MSNAPSPSFTDPAAKLWEDLAPDVKKSLLSNVWCSRCSHAVTITNFTGVVRSGDLLLVGNCSECRADVARLIEPA